MKKWADYLISEVGYDKNHLILMAKRHEDTKNGISHGELVDRIKISSDIASGLTYNTIYNRISTWKNGNKIHFFRIHGEPFLRIDENKVNQDYLGDLPEIISLPTPEFEKDIPKQITQQKNKEEKIGEFESSSSPKTQPEPPTSFSKVLPKETNVELAQELDLVPESILEPEEATPEQIARLKHLEEQIAKLESQQKEPEEATPKQTPKLQSKPRKKRIKPEEATPEQIARLKHLEEQIAKLESQQ